MELHQLKEQLINRLNESRHSLSRFCRSSKVKPLIIKYTTFLSSGCKLNIMAWHIINNINYIPICKKCKINQTKFNNNKWGYLDFCSVKCSVNSIETIKKRESTCSIKYGDLIINPFQAESVKSKIKESIFNRYGVDHNFKSQSVKDQAKITLLNKYGVDHYSKTEEFKKKYKLTIFLKYGVDHYSKTEEFNNKFKQTSLTNYGVNHPMQSLTVFQKQQNSSFYLKNYIMPSGKIVKIQGFEHFALNELLQTYEESDIVISNFEIYNSVGKFEYLDENIKRRYFPDIYIISENKIIEVKSTRTYQVNLKYNKLKKLSVLKKGINFEFWVYGKFKEIIL